MNFSQNPNAYLKLSDFPVCVKSHGLTVENECMGEIPDIWYSVVYWELMDRCRSLKIVPNFNSHLYNKNV